MSQLMENYNKAKEELYKHVGFKEDWVVLAIEDETEMFWSLLEKEVIFGEKKSFQNTDDYYSYEFYHDRFYEKSVFRGEELTLIIVDTYVDGNKFFAIFDNKKEVMWEQGEGRLLNEEFREKLILKTMIADKSFLAIIANIYESEFFDIKFGSEIFEVCKNHFLQFKDVPQKEILINSINSDVSLFLEEIENIDVDIVRNREHILAETDKHLKEKAIKKAIMNSVDIIDKNEDIAKIKDLVEEALCRTVWIDLGLKYFEQLGERLKRILENSVKRIPTYFPTFDENISGGFPAYTLSIITAAIHAGKSNMLSNMAARQVLQGHNIALLTLEMSEDAFAQRFDSILSGLDINLMYTCKDRRKLLINSLKNYKNKKNRGEVFIKQFPTGAASVKEFSAYLRELNMRGIEIDILYADYINLMKPQYKSKGDSYTDVKRISEELRALSFEFKMPVISVTQLNREGIGADFSSVGMTNVAESLGTSMTCDFMAVLGTNEDSMIYESEVWCKIVKNRLGGMIGHSFKFYIDSRSLKMYDESELDMWMNDATMSGAHRKLKGSR